MTFRPGTRGLAVIAVCSLALTACSAGSLGSSDDAGGSSSVEITYLTTNQDQDVKEAEQLAKDFHAKNPAITVKVETRPGGTEGDNIIKTRLSTGDMVDIFNYNTGSLFNAIAPQKNLLSVNDEPWVKDLDENFKKTVTAVAVPPNHPQSLAFVTKFMKDAIGNGTIRKAYDNNGLKDSPIRTQ